MVVTAVEMANESGIDPKSFRAALRAQKFHWHAHNARWEVESGSHENEQMRRVLIALLRGQK
jgi:hypothetical protein